MIIILRRQWVFSLNPKVLVFQVMNFLVFWHAYWLVKIVQVTTSSNESQCLRRSETQIFKFSIKNIYILLKNLPAPLNYHLFGVFQSSIHNPIFPAPIVKLFEAGIRTMALGFANQCATNYVIAIFFASIHYLLYRREEKTNSLQVTEIWITHCLNWYIVSYHFE